MIIELPVLKTIDYNKISYDFPISLMSWVSPRSFSSSKLSGHTNLTTIKFYDVQGTNSS